MRQQVPVDSCADDADVAHLLSDDPPPQTELIIGLVGAVGIDLTGLVSELGFILSEFGYRTHDLHLTNQLSGLDWDYNLVKEP
ncbi:MAG: hypothetical protein JW895_14055, partial [Thermoleophilaceae bacterium]|nr:hypothetical protein [Thermoleophilaceae bacterium]